MLVFIATAAFAHDVWMEVDPEESSVQIEAFLGEHLQAEEPYELASADRLSRFELRGPDGTEDVTAHVAIGRERLAELPVDGEGTYAVVLETNPAYIVVPPATFDGYIAEEGLTDVQASHPSGTPGRERYSRTLVALVGKGDKKDLKRSGAVATTPEQDLVLQLVPDANPLLAKPGDALTFQVLFQGSPLADRQVVAASRVGDDIQEQTARTDAQGHVTFDVDRAGLWIVRMVHMTPSTEAGSDWRSYGSALTFETHST